ATARPEPAATASAPASTVVATTAAAATMSVVQLDLLDVSRPTAGTKGVPASTTRALPTTVYLPAANEPAPLVVLAHGAGGAPEKFTELAGFWADSGYVVAAPRFPLTNDRVGAVVVADFPEQGRDVRFVIDEVLAASGSGSGPLAGRVDAERIGLFGLSLGSLTVWSATMDAPGEPRVDALVQSDGATFVADDRIGAVPFPVLVAHSDVDTIFPYAETVARYDLLPVEKYFLTLHGAAHASVGENTDTPADAAYQEATTAFWDRTLRGRPDTPFPAPVAGVTSFVVGTTEPLPETE
nr:hypothetical protein [Acidimicrobiia bacterium]